VGERLAECGHRTAGPLFRGRLGHPNAVLPWTARGDASIFISDAAFVASLKDVKQDPSLAVAVVPNAGTAYLALAESERMRVGERIPP
jgi:hypothetical protein